MTNIQRTQILNTIKNVCGYLHLIYQIASRKKSISGKEKVPEKMQKKKKAKCLLIEILFCFSCFFFLSLTTGTCHLPRDVVTNRYSLTYTNFVALTKPSRPLTLRWTFFIWFVSFSVAIIVFLRRLIIVIYMYTLFFSISFHTL